MYAIITTVGRSLLDNFRKSKQDQKTEQEADRKTEQKLDKLSLVEYLKREDASKASAETNSLSRIIPILKKKHQSAKIKIQFIHSDTDEGRLCAEVLKAHFKNNGLEPEVYQVNNLKYDADKFKYLGLKSLVDELARIIDNNDRLGYKTIINATGGFKAEIAYATLVGLMYHHAVESVYYIYEGFKDIVELPSLPISLDIKHWKKYEHHLEQLSKGVPRNQVENRVPPELRFLTIDEDQMTKLSPAGELFYLGYLENKKIREVSLADKQKIAHLDDKGHLKVTQRESTLWGEAIETIEDIPEKEVRDIFTRIITFEEVEKIALGKYHRVGKSHETHMTFKDKNERNHTLRYELLCKSGKTIVVIRVKPGFTTDLLFMLGKKIYP